MYSPSTCESSVHNTYKMIKHSILTQRPVMHRGQGWAAPFFFPSMSKFGPYPESMRHPLGNKLFVLSILVFIEIKDTGKGSIFAAKRKANDKPAVYEPLLLSGRLAPRRGCERQPPNAQIGEVHCQTSLSNTRARTTCSPSLSRVPGAAQEALSGTMLSLHHSI